MNIAENGIKKRIKDAITSITSIFEFKVDFIEGDNSISIFPRFMDGMQCPYVLILEYEICEDNILLYETWALAKSGASGDKNDIYSLFGNTMNILLKNMMDIPCVFQKWILNYDTEIVIGGALQFYKGYQLQREDEIEELVSGIFHRMLMLMGTHAGIFGSYANKLIDNDDDSLFLIDGIIIADNCISREDHKFYENSKIKTTKFCLSEQQYDFKSLFRHLPKCEFVLGDDCTVLIQNQAERKFCNYIPLDKWHLIETITNFLDDEYYMLCQENYFYIFSQNNIWAIEGDFSSYWADTEIILTEMREAEKIKLLHLNTKFAWKYPVNAARFEQLIADLLETESNVASAHLMGKTNNADGGRDIRIKKRLTDGETKNKIILGQCKAYQKSVNKSHVTDIRDTIEMYDADGFFLAVTSDITNPLINHLEKLGQRYEVEWWTGREIFERLRKNYYLVERYSDIIDVIEE